MGRVQDLRKHFIQTLRERKLLRRGLRALVAVSGGVDSMVLVNLLAGLPAELAGKISVAHFNHQLRGRAAAADEQLVARTAARLGLPFFSGRANVKLLARTQSISIEMAARTARHQFLAAAARRCKCSLIVTAHHADDQVELFFIRLLRGAGAAGLAGMPWESRSPVDAKLRLVRPLLDVPKEELLAFARTHKITYREDASNASLEPVRNRIRQELLPLLRKGYQPGLNGVVLRLMDTLRHETELTTQAAAEWFAAPGRGGWEKLPVAVQRRIIWRQLLRRGLTPDFSLVEKLRQRESAVCVAPGNFLIRGHDGMLSAPVAEKGVTFLPDRQDLNLACRGSVSFGGIKVSWRPRENGSQPPGRGRKAEFFDADKVGVSAVLRHWQPGDRFQPIGMKSAVKLQDWFTNQKIPARRRRELLLATTSAGEIFWVEGLRIGELAKRTAATRRVLEWRWSAR